MKHATAATLDRIAPLLGKLRALPDLKERTRGVFYLKSKAFLHFHEDPEGVFADLKIDGSFQRFGVNSRPEWRDLLRRVRGASA